jgi:hypothetical protein
MAPGSHRRCRSPVAWRCAHCPGRLAVPSVTARMRAELVLTSAGQPAHLPAETAGTSTRFTIFECTPEIQRMIIGRAVTGLDVL